MNAPADRHVCAGLGGEGICGVGVSLCPLGLDLAVGWASEEATGERGPGDGADSKHLTTA